MKKEIKKKPKKVRKAEKRNIKTRRKKKKRKEFLKRKKIKQALKAKEIKTRNLEIKKTITLPQTAYIPPSTQSDSPLENIKKISKRFAPFFIPQDNNNPSKNSTKDICEILEKVFEEIKKKKNE